MPHNPHKANSEKKTASYPRPRGQRKLPLPAVRSPRDKLPQPLTPARDSGPARAPGWDT